MWRSKVKEIHLGFFIYMTDFIWILLEIEIILGLDIIFHYFYLIGTNACFQQKG